MKTNSFAQLLNLTALASSLILPISTSAAAKVATPAESLTVLPGFKVELIKSSDAALEGSWVSMTVDDKGRLIISPQGKEPILRLTLDGKGHIAKQETIKLPVTSAMGLLYHKGTLYVNGVGKEGY